MSNALSDVEHGLYKRMVRNAFWGFVKNGLWGIVLGAAIGAVVFALAPAALTALIPLAFTHIATALLGATATATATTALAGAITGASAMAIPAASFGAVAGIQSTRDARRYLVGHEVQRESKIPETVDPLAEIKKEITGTYPERNTDKTLSFADKIRAESTISEGRMV